MTESKIIPSMLKVSSQFRVLLIMLLLIVPARLASASALSSAERGESIVIVESTLEGHSETETSDALGETSETSPDWDEAIGDGSMVACPLCEVLGLMAQPSLPAQQSLGLASPPPQN